MKLIDGKLDSGHIL